MATSYNVISKDGYIATKDGKEDFIPSYLWDTFLDICRQNDVVVIGRKTYEAIQTYSSEHITEFEQLEVKIVVVSRDDSFYPKESYIKVSIPEKAIKYGNKILLCSGPSLNSYFLEKNLIDKFIRVILPQNIYDGIKPFIHEPDLVLETSRELENGESLQTYVLNSSSNVVH